MENEPSNRSLPAWLLPIFSWAVSLYLSIDLVRSTGFFPNEDLLLRHAALVLAILFFLFLPFFSKIKIGKLLEIERDVAKTKEEIAGFKSEVRSALSLISTNVNSISGISNQLTLNLPNPAEIRELRQEVESKSHKELAKPAKQEEIQASLQREDPTLALAWTRIEMERLLRKILEKRTDSSGSDLGKLRLASLRQLFSSFTSKYPAYEYLSDAFRYVNSICNAAIHAQSVSPDQAREALGLGGQVILILKNLAGEAAGFGDELTGIGSE